MRQFLICLCIFLYGLSFGQTSKTSMQVFDEKLKAQSENLKRLESQVEKSQHEILDRFSELKNSTTENVANYKRDTRDTINLYVYFITAGVVLLGFAINFFGRRAIKGRVEELIKDTAQAHIEIKIVETLNSKITNELIEGAIKEKSEDEINKILDTIRDKGNSAIDELKNKGDAAIKSMLASPPRIKIRVGKKAQTDSEINEQNKSLRAEEFFNLAYQSKDPRIRIGLYKNVLEIEPSNYFALNNTAVSYNDLNEPKNAVEALDKVIAINPNYAIAYANRAQSYNLLNDFEKALLDVDKALQLDNKLEFAFSVKGSILTKQEKYPEAEKVLNTAIEMNPNSAESYFNRGFFYEERKEYAKSESDYNKAEELGMENKAMLYNNMAVLYRRLKDFDKAIDFLNKARQFNPDYPNIDGTLALIYSDKNDEENFYKYLKVALEKGCPVWDYLTDPAFNKYRDTRRLKMLIEPYKKKYYA
jgi:tetratricopeptide (TPR) repeat protein